MIHSRPIFSQYVVQVWELVWQVEAIWGLVHCNNCCCSRDAQKCFLKGKFEPPPDTLPAKGVLKQRLIELHLCKVTHCFPSGSTQSDFTQRTTSEQILPENNHCLLIFLKKNNSCSCKKRAFLKNESLARLPNCWPWHYTGPRTATPADYSWLIFSAAFSWYLPTPALLKPGLVLRSKVSPDRHYYIISKANGINYSSLSLV